MVYGNMGNNSATGVAFSRDAATGENLFNGEYLINAQGEDVVAGIRTPQQITIEGSKRWAALQGISEEERAAKYPSLEESMPVCANELFAIAAKLEDYYRDMQDMEFTIQDGKLGCSRLVTANAQVLPWLRLPWTFSVQAGSTRRQLSCAWSPETRRTSPPCIRQGFAQTCKRW